MFERRQEGGVELRLSRDERSLLPGWSELRALLDGAPGDPSLRRLFPPAYDEAEADKHACRADGRRAARRPPRRARARRRDRRPRRAQAPRRPTGWSGR